MSKPFFKVHRLILLLCCAAPAVAAAAAERTVPDLHFEANRGQFPEDVAYVARGPGYHVVIDDRGASYDLGALDGSRRVRVTMRGGRAPEAVVPAGALPGRINYFLGNDPEKWVTGAPTFRRVRLRGVYEGIDVDYYADGSRAEYDFVVAPGADPTAIALAFEGADGVRVDAQGRLVLRVGEDELRTAPPVAFQIETAVGNGGEERREVPVAFSVAPDGAVRFRLGAYDASRELVIDPVILDYSTSLGGSAADIPTGLQVGSDGTIYVSGRTLSADFQGGPGMLAGMEDVFVSRISADGTTLLYTTFLGGSDAEFPLDLVVNAAGDAFVVTQTFSNDLPTLNAFDATLGGNQDYAVARFDTSGALSYGTYYGGSGDDGAFDDGGIALHPSGDVYITGRTSSLPPAALTNAYQSSACAGQCAFVAGFDTTESMAASLVYGSYVDGNSDDGGQDIDIDSAGDLYVFGFTASTTGLVDAAQAFQPVTNNVNDQDNFLVVLDTTLSGAAQRVYSTYIGSPTAEAEPRGGVLVESASAVFVTGATDGVADATFPYTAGFPIKNAVQGSPGGGEDAYLAKIDTTTTGDPSLVFSTFLGGPNTESGSDIATDSTGTISVALNFSSWTDTVAPLAEFAAFSDVSLVQLDPTGQTIQTAVPLPGAYRLAVDASDRLLVAGAATAAFPQLGPLPASPAGGAEVFLARFESLPLTGATLSVDASAGGVAQNTGYAYLFTLTNNGEPDITDFTITGVFPAGLSTVASALCFSSITCQPSDPSDFMGADAIQPNERLTLFVRAEASSMGSFDIASLTATTTPADPDPSDNSDGTDVDVVLVPPPPTGLLTDFDAWGLSSDTGGFAVDSPLGVLATGNGVMDETANFMVFDGSIPIYVADVYSRGKLAIGFVERSTWTPSNGDFLSLLDIDSGFGTVDRVYAQVELVGRGPLARVELRSGDAFSSSVGVPGAVTQVGLEPDKAFTVAVDTGLETATVSYDGQVILSGNPFSTVLSGGADVGDVGDDMVVSVGGGRLDLGGARFSDEPIPVPEPALWLGVAAGVAGLGGLARRRRGSRPLPGTPGLRVLHVRGCSPTRPRD